METTGRKFKCIGLEEKERYHWSKHYIKGKIYEEYAPTMSKDSLFIHSEDDCAFIVDADQFEEVKN